MDNSNQPVIPTKIPVQPLSTPNPINNKKGAFPIVLGVLVLLLVFGAGTYYFVKNTVKKEVKSTEIPTNEPNPKIEILATLPPEDPQILYNILFDPYSRTAVYSINKGQSTVSSSSNVIYGIKTDKTYTEINSLTISPDGKRVAYIAKQDDKEFVVVDGIEGKKYDYIKNLRFSPDSQHFAYSAGEEKYFQEDSKFSGNYTTKTAFIVVDTTEGKKYDGIDVGVNISQTYNPFFSKDGKKITYTAIKNGKNVIMLDNKELSDYSNQQFPQFIGNTYDLIYLASENNKYFFIVADEKKTSYDFISDLNGMPYFIGKDASQLAYEATANDINSVIVNDSSYPITSGVLQDLAFSNSGKYAAYYTGTWMSKDLFVNGKNLGIVQPNANTTVSNPLFSPDEQILVYSEYSQKEQNAAIHIFSTNSLEKIVDFPLTGFKVIGQIRFSDDGKSLYFKGQQERKIEFITLDIDKLINGK